MAAIRVRKLLDKAASVPGTPEADAYTAKARARARAHPRGRAIIYDGKPVLGDDDATAAVAADMAAGPA